MTSDLGVTMTTVFGFQSLLGNITCEDSITFIGADASFISPIFLWNCHQFFLLQGIEFVINFTDKKGFAIITTK